jgi:serine/threonine-protein kinase
MMVGRYVLLRELARGGMAEIWLARNPGVADFEREFVIKRILSASDTAGPEFNQMFMDEARISAQLQHANIVQVFELGFHQDSPFMVMEYLPGESVARVARAASKRGDQLPIPLVLHVIAEAAAGLGYAHRKTALDGAPLHIVHRDVSPQNLFITYEGAVKVLDFGIAKAQGRLTRTATGALKGKIAYMPPEQALGRDVDASTDVFALGVVLFELLTLTRLYESRDDLAVLQALNSDAPRPAPSSRRPGIPREVDALVAKTLATNSLDRPADGFELKRAAEECMRAIGAHASTDDLRGAMHGLFGERIQQLGDFLASARAGVIPEAATPSGKGPTMPGRTPNPTVATRQPKPRRRPLLLVGGVALALPIGIALALASKPAQYSVVVATEPPDSTLEVDGQAAGPSPVLLHLKAGPHAIAASKPGFVPQARSLNVEADDRLVLTLAPQPIAAAPTPPPVPTPAPPPAPAPEVVPPKPATPDKTAARRAGTMRLNLETRPWTRVYLGTKLLGDTPLVDVPVPAGDVKLRLVNEEQHIDTTVELSGRAGEQLFKNLSF